MNIEKFPTISESQYALKRTDLYTGLIKDEEMINALSPMQKVYSIFDSIEEAINAGNKIVIEYDFIECVIYDCRQQIITTIYPE